MLPHSEFCSTSTDDFLFDALCSTPLMHLPELVDVAAKVAYQGARPRDADNTPVPPLKYFIRTVLERATRCRFPVVMPSPNTAFRKSTSRNTLEATTDSNGYSRLDSPFARAIHTTTFLAALVYVDRCARSPLLAGQEGRRGYKSAAHRIFLAALLVAAKYNEDPQRISRKALQCFGGPADAIPEAPADRPQPHYVAGIFKNKYWAAYSGAFSVQEVNLMEFQFLSLLDHNLRVTREDIMSVVLATSGAREILDSVAKRFIAPTVDAATTLAEQHVERAPSPPSSVTRKVRSNTVCGSAAWAEAIAAGLHEETKAETKASVSAAPSAPVLSIPPPPVSLPPASVISSRMNVDSVYSTRTMQLTTRALRSQLGGALSADQKDVAKRGRSGSMGTKDVPAAMVPNVVPRPRVGLTEQSRRRSVACFPPSIAAVVATGNSR